MFSCGAHATVLCVLLLLRIHSNVGRHFRLHTNTTTTSTTTTSMKYKISASVCEPSPPNPPNHDHEKLYAKKRSTHVFEYKTRPRTASRVSCSRRTDCAKFWSNVRTYTIVNTLWITMKHGPLGATSALAQTLNNSRAHCRTNICGKCTSKSVYISRIKLSIHRRKSTTTTTAAIQCFCDRERRAHSSLVLLCTSRLRKTKLSCRINICIYSWMGMRTSCFYYTSERCRNINDNGGYCKRAGLSAGWFCAPNGCNVCLRV